jgi:rhomboid family GlyGly-CTERM serine protease
VIGAIFCSPAATAWLQFDRDAVAAGQWWRLLTSHLTHWNGENLLWNVVVFALLGWLCEACNRLRFAACVALSALLIGITTWLFAPQLATFRGISGVDSALFAFLAVTVLRAQWAERNWPWTVATAALIVGFGVKVFVELRTGRALFVDSTAAGFTPMPVAHAVGAAVGGLLALTDPGPRRR